MKNWLKYSSPGVLVALIAVGAMHFRAPIYTGHGPQFIGRPPTVWLKANTDTDDYSGFVLSDDGQASFLEGGLSNRFLNLKCDPYDANAPSNGKTPGFRHCKVIKYAVDSKP